jgi:hypothetical protein
MLAHEVLRAAAETVRAGWSEGGAAARDAEGREVPLYAPAVGGTSRAGINPAAVRFSAYGAIAKALAAPGSGAVSHARIWGRLSDAARAKSPVRPGGTNFMHPLVQFNADEERTAEDVAGLLLEVADAMEKEAAAVSAGRAS